MKHKHLFALFAMFALLAAVRTSVVAQNQVPAAPDTALGTAFTYQGWLNDGGAPANGSYDFQFVVYNAGTGGSQVGSVVQKEDVQVTSGYFTVHLDFGAGVFGAQARWLEVGVRPGASTGSFTTLSPRQPLTPAPTALYAPNAGSVPWSGLTGVPAGFADGIDNDTLAALSCTTGQIPKLGAGGWACAPDANTAYAAGTGLSLTGTTFSLLAAYRLPQGCANKQMPMWNGSAWVCANGVLTNGSYANPSWITSLAASKITGILPVANGGTGSASQNFVDLSSNQSIGGIKTFTSAPSFSAAAGAPFTVSSTTQVTNLNADQVDGYHAGNSSGQIPVSNGTVNANLNAALLNGQPADAFQKHYQNEIVVAKAGGDYTTITAALNNIPTSGAGAPSSTNHYLIYVAPGAYAEQVIMKDFVDIQGAGEEATKITYSGASVSYDNATLIGASNAELRFLTVENTGNHGDAVGIYASSIQNFHLTHATINVFGATSGYNVGMENYNNSIVYLDEVRINVDGDQNGGYNSYGILTDTTYGAVDLNQVTIYTAAPSANNSYSLFMYEGRATITSSYLQAYNGYVVIGIYANASATHIYVDITMDRSSIQVGAGTNQYPLYVDGNHVTAQVGGSRLEYGKSSINNSAVLTCVYDYDGAYSPLSSTCQ